VPTAVQARCWFFDENSIGVAKALHYVRGDVTWPGGPGGLVPEGANDSHWLPVVGKAGLVVLTRDKRIRRRPLERQALLANGVRACFQTTAGQLSLFEQLQLWLRHWSDIESLVEKEPPLWSASVTRAGVKIFEAGGRTHD
jgi:PIN domain-containing protein